MSDSKSSLDSSFTVRPAASTDEARDFWWPQMQELGWNRYVPDHATHTASGGTSLLLYNPQPIGMIMPLTYANRTGWIGFFVVASAHQGSGGGRQLWNASTAHFAERGVETVGLDAVLAQVPTYAQRGFEEKGRVHVLQRKGGGEVPLPLPAKEEGEGGLEADEELVTALVGARGAESDEEQQYAASDFALTGLDRRNTWTRAVLFHRPDVRGAKIVSRDGSLRSWIVLRECEQGYRVGPLYAANRAHARILLRTVMEEAERGGRRGGALTAEVWGENPEAVALFKELGWEESGVQYARMWLHGKVPEAQSKGGVAERKVWAWWDAGAG